MTNKQVKSILNNFLKSNDIDLKQIGCNYYFNYKYDYFVFNTITLTYKSLFNEQEAIDYCLDKINTESKQIVLW